MKISKAWNIKALLCTASVFSALLSTEGVLAQPLPSYDGAFFRMVPRSATLTNEGQRLHVVVDLENKLDEAITVSLTRTYSETYAFDDVGGKWQNAKEIKGVEDSNVPCRNGTLLKPRESRPVLFQLSGKTNVKPTSFSFGTVLYRCMDVKSHRVSIAIDGVVVSGSQ